MNGSLRKPCLPGTRTRLLTEIISWATQSNVENEEKNVLWLHGMAGSGKSTVATTVAHHFDSLKRQGAYLFFERATSTPSTVICTLAYELALFDPAISSAISKCLSADPKIAEKSLHTQFEMLLYTPLTEAAHNIAGPVTVVLDALDECGDQSSREELLDILGTKLQTLPPAFRFLITSRPEEDIRTAFKKTNLIMSLESMVEEKEALSDIKAYFVSQTAIIRENKELENDWPSENQIDSLVKSSEGLFIWASTMCKLIRQTPVHELGSLLAGSSNQGIQGLDLLYTTTLERSYSWSSAGVDSWNHFRSVMAVVLFSRINLDVAAVDLMLGVSGQASSRFLVSSFSALLEYSTGNTIRPLHASFRDYLTDKNRSGGKPWSLTSVDPERLLTEACFQIMSKQLRFNICGITTSYKEDNDYFTSPNTRDAISKELKYACQHWATHLKGVHTLDGTLIKLLEIFSYDMFLFWDEVIEISKLWDESRKICEEISDFIKVSCIITT